MLIRRGARSQADDDAIWRGDIADEDIVMTATEHAARAARRERRRRSLVELFGEPVGAVSIDDATFRHRRRDARRHGVGVDTRRTAGCREEIQVAILAHPVVATELICDHALFTVARGLEVDRASETGDARQLSWSATIRTWPWARRASRLRVYGSPSSNITVLALAPLRSRRLGVRRYLRVGLRSMFAVRDAVEGRLAATSRS